MIGEKNIWESRVRIFLYTRLRYSKNTEWATNMNNPKRASDTPYAVEVEAGFRFLPASGAGASALSFSIALHTDDGAA